MAQVQLDEMAGKTVANVFMDYTDEILIVFSDGTFALVCGYESGDEVTVENGNFSLRNWNNYADELLALGVVNQAQYDKHMVDTEHYSRQATAVRRMEYERLKAEFESEGKADGQ